MAPEAPLVLRSSWPGTTIGGKPGIVSGILELSRADDGSAFLNLAVGPAGASAEDCDYVEFVLSAEQAAALASALLAGSS
jgi:hypothetical protein